MSTLDFVVDQLAAMLADQIAETVVERVNTTEPDPTERALVVRLEVLAREHATTVPVVKGWVRNGLRTHPMPSAGTWVLRTDFEDWLHSLADRPAKARVPRIGAA